MSFGSDGPKHTLFVILQRLSEHTHIHTILKALWGLKLTATEYTAKNEKALGYSPILLFNPII